MKVSNPVYLIISIVALQSLFLMSSAQQKAEALPKHLFETMRDSTDYIDVVFLKGEGGSLSIDVFKSVRYFNTFFKDVPAEKTNDSPSGTIMWLIRGREFISGKYFTGDSTGYVVLEKDGKEYVNLIDEQGNSFFRSKIR